MTGNQKMEPTMPVTDTPRPPNRQRWRIGLVVAVATLLIALGWWATWLTLPTNAPHPITFIIAPGASVSEIAAEAQTVGLVRSPFLLYALLTLRYDPSRIRANAYSFTEPHSVFTVARILGTGAGNDIATRVTIPEGMRLHDIATLVEASVPNISAAAYAAAAAGKEGYLFPETYFVPTHFQAADLVALQLATFADRTATLQSSLPTSSPHSLADIVTLASIVEAEANSPESMRVVAGIFENRLAAGMPLQADATIEYDLGQDLHELSPGALAQELRERDSPYNTYRYRGLPPTPIGNPGLVALQAVAAPQASDYYYYLTDIDGTFHYAKTLAEHTANVERYLRQGRGD